MLLTTLVIAALGAFPSRAGAASQMKGETQAAGMRLLLESGLATSKRAQAVSGDPLARQTARSFHANASAPRAYDAVNDRALRLPDVAFTPATIQSGDDYPLDAAGANGLGFRVNHWWGYDRLGMTGGYFELAGAVTTDSGEAVGFGWQGSIYGSNVAAGRALSDGRSRTAQWGSDKDCSDILHIPCHLLSYPTSNGGFAQYVVMQTAQCVGEFKAFSADENVYHSHASAIATTSAIAIVAGAKVLADACKGVGAPPSTPAQKPASKAAAASPVDPQFHGNCAAYRGAAWGVAQRASELQQQWWEVLQDDYNSNYPPPTGGSVPGVTGSQLGAARWDMNDIHKQLIDNNTGTGLAFQFGFLASSYGIKKIDVKGPYTWAANRVFGAIYYLDQAAQKEFAATGKGLADFHVAQSMLSNSWDALKQLPCG
jgi:hypothetical protein